VLRKIFRTKRKELGPGYRRRFKEELHDLCNSLNIIRVIKDDEMGVKISKHGREDKCIKYFVW
jgi:hypothetical protein